MIICSARQVASSDPKFHHAEMLEGLGRSMTRLLIIFIIGWVFRRFVAIKFL